MYRRKIYFVDIIIGFLNVLNQFKEPLRQNLENNISRDLGSETYILSLTMKTIVALNLVSALLGNCRSGNLM